MKDHRTQRFISALGMATLAGACFLWSTANLAEDFPTRPARFISAMAPGGSGDLNARRLAEALRGRLGQPVVVENRSGAGGSIAAVAAAGSTPDGYTLFFASDQIFTVNPILRKKLPFSLDDFQPLALVSRAPHVLLVSAAPAKSLAELVAYAKSRPAGLHFGSGGVSTSPHLAGELFKGLAGIKLVHVPYKGAAPSLTALLGDEIQLLFDSTLTSIGHIRGGRARGLAIASLTRSEQLPDLPTFDESGFRGFQAGVTHGLLLPAKTPRARAALLSKLVNEVLNDPAYRKKMTDLGAQVLGGTPERFRSHLIEERKKWEIVIKRENIHL
ncbi:MAG: tripartite tricarboxylate transporter substrate binding protein [Betaproteobacteria bacterium]|nr:tripartite tricarboxylate transporter substrate binding protein [Betaproteobacteria bacterium]